MLRCLAVLALWLAPVSAIAGPRTIAIAYFDNHTGKPELDPLRKGLADMLITDLGNVAALQIVERARLDQVIGELKLARSKFIDPATAQRLGKGLAAELIMTGSYVLAGQTLRVDVRVIEVATGKVVASEKMEGDKDSFFAIEKDLVDLLVKTLDVKLSSAERGKLRANATQSFDAWQKYSAGLDAKDRGDDALARQLFQAALDADPSYRAAKTATERLAVIFQRADAAKAAALDQAWKGLDPKAADFAERTDQLLAGWSNSDAGELARKVGLLRYLAERDLTPTMPGGFSRVSLEVMSLLWRFNELPDGDQVLPPVCEYVLRRFPKDQSAPAQCKLLLQALARDAGLDRAERVRRWDHRWQGVTLDWELALKAAMPDIVALFRLYGQKSARP